MESLRNNETWDLVEIPEGRKPIDNKWVFKKKDKCNRISREVHSLIGHERVFTGQGI